MFSWTVARPLNVLHEVRAAGGGRSPDALRQRERPRLVVDGVERRHEVERLRVGIDVERAEVALRQVDVREAALGRLSARVRDRVRRQVEAVEGALRKALGEQQERAAASAAEVERERPPRGGRSCRERAEDVREEHREDRLRALLGHHLVKARIAVVGHAPARSRSTRRCRPRRSRLVIHCASTARLSGEAARVSQACSAGSE